MFLKVKRELQRLRVHYRRVERKNGFSGDHFTHYGQPAVCNPASEAAKCINIYNIYSVFASNYISMYHAEFLCFSYYIQFIVLWKKGMNKEREL